MVERQEKVEFHLLQMVEVVIVVKQMEMQVMV